MDVNEALDKRIIAVDPFLAVRAIELVTSCSGLATVAAGRRWSLTGDRGGRIEVDSVWIHLDTDEPERRPWGPKGDRLFSCHHRGNTSTILDGRYGLSEPHR